MRRWSSTLSEVDLVCSPSGQRTAATGESRMHVERRCRLRSVLAFLIFGHTTSFVCSDIRNRTLLFHIAIYIAIILVSTFTSSIKNHTTAHDRRRKNKHATMRRSVALGQSGPQPELFSNLRDAHTLGSLMTQATRRLDLPRTPADPGNVSLACVRARLFFFV